jgi:hypothetical protein
MRRASSYVVVASSLFAAATLSLSEAVSQPASSPAASGSLDYGFFKTKVQAVFLARRAGHARCVVCHTFNNAAFKLVPLSPGSTTWNEEQSRLNFELVKRVAVGGLESKLLKHPLAEEAGGDPHHGGAQQFASQQDPDWLTLKAFVSGETVK